MMILLSGLSPDDQDTLLVSDLSHSVTNYVPLYPGDRVYLVTNARHIIDLTPAEGSIYRSIAIQCEGSIYNQRGEKVSDVIVRVTENLKKYKEGRGRRTRLSKIYGKRLTGKGGSRIITLMMTGN